VTLECAGPAALLCGLTLKFQNLAVGRVAERNKLRLILLERSDDPALPFAIGSTQFFLDLNFSNKFSDELLIVQGMKSGGVAMFE
jgi:hypothetical protein